MVTERKTSMMETLTPSLFACDIEARMRSFDKSPTFLENEKNGYVKIFLLSGSKRKTTRTTTSLEGKKTQST